MTETLTETLMIMVNLSALTFWLGTKFEKTKPSRNYCIRCCRNLP